MVNRCRDPQQPESIRDSADVVQDWLNGDPSEEELEDDSDDEEEDSETEAESEFNRDMNRIVTRAADITRDHEDESEE